MGQEVRSAQDIANTDAAFDAVDTELMAAVYKFPKFNSAHEGYAVLLEEVDELWEEVKKNPKTRSKERLRAEAIQVAAMALRFIIDCT